MILENRKRWMETGFCGNLEFPLPLLVLWVSCRIWLPKHWVILLFRWKIDLLNCLLSFRKSAKSFRVVLGVFWEIQQHWSSEKDASLRCILRYITHCQLSFPCLLHVTYVAMKRLYYFNMLHVFFPYWRLYPHTSFLQSVHCIVYVLLLL